MPTIRPQKYILVVEDELLVLDTFRRALASHDEYYLDTASTLAEAMEKVSSISYDIVFLDMKIDGQSYGGMEVLRYIARLREQAILSRQIPPRSLVVIMTGSVSIQPLQQEAHRLGTICFMDKPVAFTIDFVRMCLNNLGLLVMPPRTPEPLLPPDEKNNPD